MNKIAHYREKCIGCGVCYEQQPALWRMSTKDGKATLVNAVQKREVYLLKVNNAVAEETEKIAHACPVKIIKVL